MKTISAKVLFLNVFVLIAGLTAFPSESSAQDFAVKTNILYDATATANLGLEIGLAPKWTLDVSGNLNAWDINSEANRKWKHWLLQPEARYWLCERFNGHFFGLHTGYGFYNIGGVRVLFHDKATADRRYQGWATGVGVSYGYSWILGKRWNLEANIGFGYVYTNYDQYDCVTCGQYRGTRSKHLFLPTRAGISLVYIIK